MSVMTPKSTTELKRVAHTIRQRTIETSASAKIPHLGSCLSCVELLTALYWQELNIAPTAPDCQDRDRFVMSKGHGAPVLFQVLAERGFFQLKSYLSSDNPGVCSMSTHQNRGIFPEWKLRLVRSVMDYQWPLEWRLRNVSKGSKAVATPC